MIEAKAHIFEVALAYAGSLTLIAVLIWVTLWQDRRSARDLDRVEKPDG